MEAVDSATNSEDSRANTALQHVLQEETVDFYKESMQRIAEIVKQTAQNRSEFTETLAKQLWERNSEIDKLNAEFAEFREKSGNKLDTTRQILKEEREECEKLRNEKTLWLEGSQTQFASFELQNELKRALAKVAALEAEKGENQLKIQHEKVNQKLQKVLEADVKRKDDEIQRLSAEMLDLKIQLTTLDEKCGILDAKLTEEHLHSEELKQHLLNEQLRAEELIKDVEAADNFGEDWKRYSIELQAELENCQAEFELVMARRDAEIEDLSRRVSRSLPRNSLDAERHSSDSSLDDTYLPAL